MIRGRQWWAIIVTIVLSAGIFLTLPAQAGGKQTFTGEVGDAMCGVKHMQGAPPECTRSCVLAGSMYALIVGDKVYSLVTTDKAALAVLDKQAGSKATVTGVAKDGTITVSSVVAAN